MEIIRTNRKSLAIIIKSDGSLLVRSPLKTPISYIEDFIKRKHSWIEAKTKEVLTHPHSQIESKKFIDGEEFLYLGKKYFLKIGK
jgi:predicted metal-dependent hydrolase